MSFADTIFFVVAIASIVPVTVVLSWCFRRKHEAPCQFDTSACTGEPYLTNLPDGTST